MTADELFDLAAKINDEADRRQGGDSAGGSAERWAAIQCLRYASNAVHGAAIYQSRMDTAEEHPVPS